MTDPKPRSAAEMRRVLKLAADALRYQLRGDDEHAQKTVQKISNGFGGGGVELALRGWADYLIERMPDRPDTARLRLVDVTDGSEPGIDNIPAELAWATRMVAARRTLDMAMWDDLMAALPRDPKLIGRHVAALLETVALNVKHLEATR